MKKSVLISALALAVSMGAQAKTADELRVYINPGHGSWTGDDRPCTLVGHGAYSRTNTDTLSFFESNTNLRKGFSVLETLRAAGLKYDPTLNQTGERWQIGAARDMSNNIVMSHVKCGPYLDDNATSGQYKEMIKAQEKLLAEGGDPVAIQAEIDRLKNLKDVVSVRYNRNLSEICAEVTANNFDMFISIHSNAATEGTSTNYPLFIYGGYDDMHAGTGYVTVERQQLSREMAKASWGYAFETPHSQWTYYSATNMNIRGDMNFYGTTSTNGYLGALKHNAPGYLVEGYFHTYQPARHRAMNWDVCAVEGYAYARGIIDYFGLKKSGKGVIYGIVRDQYEKFKDAAYKPNAVTPDAYKPLNGVTVTLKKDGNQVATYTTDEYYNGAYVFKDLEAGTYTLEFAHPDYRTLETPVEVTVKANEVSYPIVSLINNTWEPPTVIYENYPNTDVPGTLAADEYEFNQTYVDEPIAELEGKTVKRVIARANNLYIFARDEQKAPTILVYDALNKKVAATVSTEGCQGVVNPVGDIQVTADGVLVATNESLNQFSTSQVEPGEERGVSRIYRWENDQNGLPTGTPVEIGNSMLSGNMYRGYVGCSMAYSGTINDGKIVVPIYSWYESNAHSLFFNIYNIVDGEMASATFNNGVNADYLQMEKLGDFQFITSPLNDDSFVVASAMQPPTQYLWDNVKSPIAMPAGMADGTTTGAFFKYNKHAYMVAADNVDGKNAGLKLVDVTDGLDKSKAISTVNTALPEAGIAAVAGSVVPVLDAEENVTAAYINLFAVRDGKVSRLTTEGVTVNAKANPLAYGLKQTLVDGTYLLAFKSTADVEEAYVVLTNKADAEDVVRIPVSVSKGGNQVPVDPAEFEAGKEYKWAVELHAKTNPVSGQYMADNNGNLSVRGGVIPITDPEYDSFGYVAVGHGKNAGIDVYDPAGNKIGTRLHMGHTMFGGAGNTNQSDPFRGNELRGEAVFATWGDKGYGAVRVNLVDQTVEPQTLFAGTKQSSGAFMYNNVNLGGGTAGICFLGEGDNTKMYSFSEDHAGTSNTIVRYDLGSGWQITTAPTEIGYKGRLANTNVDLLGYGNGYFASQVRGKGNNAEGTPGFIYVEATDDTEQFNSATLATEDNGNLQGCNSGVAISKDGKTFVAMDGADALVYDVTWNGDKPTMTYRYKFPAGTAWSHARFDYAGNLLVYEREKGGLHCYALAAEKPVVSVPAKAEYVIAGTQGVEDIVIEGADNNAPVIYYNLQGIQVDADNMTPGVYVKVQGKTSTKVVVK